MQNVKSVQVSNLQQTQASTVQESRKLLMALQEACLKQVQVSTPITEYLSDGTYARQIFIPKGTCVVGEIHRTPWIIIVSRGKLEVATDTGLTLIDATEHPVTFVGEAGVKRAVNTLEDTWWTCIRHVGELTTTEEIRKAHIAQSFDEIGVGECLGQ